MASIPQRLGITTFVAVCAVLALACGSGETSEALERAPGPSGVPPENELVPQWQLGRARAVAIVRVDEVLETQWSVESAPESRQAVPDDAVIFRDARVLVEDVLFGAEFGGTSYLRTLGGTIDGVTVSVPDQPSFEAGRRYLLFVEPTRDPRTEGVANEDGVSFTWAVVGGSLGAWEIDDDFSAEDARDRVCAARDVITDPGLLTCAEEAPLLAELAAAADVVVLAIAGPTSPDRCRDFGGRNFPVRDTELQPVTALIGGDAPLALQQPGVECEGVAAHPEGLVELQAGVTYLLFLQMDEREDGELRWRTPEGVWPEYAVWRVRNLEPRVFDDGRGHQLDYADVIRRLRGDDEAAAGPAELGCTTGFIVGLEGRPIDPGIVPGEPLPAGLIEALRGVRLSAEDFETVEVTDFSVRLRSADGLASRPETGEAFAEVVLVRDEEALAEGLAPERWVVVEVSIRVPCEG